MFLSMISGTVDRIEHCTNRNPARFSTDGRLSALDFLSASESLAGCLAG